MNKFSKALVLGAMAFSAVAFAAPKGKTVKIGGVAPLSGAVAVYGVECKNGIDLAVSEINAAGGINGQQVQFICEDDEGDAAKSVNAYKKLVTRDRVRIIIGSLTSGCTIAITKQAQAQKVIQIAPAATAPAITDAGNYIFRTCFIDPFQGKVGGKFAFSNLNTKNAAVLYDIGNDYSVGLTENFEKKFTEEGGEIVAKESYQSGDKDFNAQLTKIKNANPDVVYLPDYYGTVALIAKQLRAQGITCAAVGPDGWDGIANGAGAELLNGYYSNHYALDANDEKGQKFYAAYKERFGTAPTSFAALSYDSVFMLKDAIAKAGTADPEKVRDALAATDGDYITGHITFDEHHNPVKTAVILEFVQGDDGKISSVYKASVQP